jgi:hypothetical protein
LLPVTIWMSSRTLAGIASVMPSHVHAGEPRTASTTSPRIAMPRTLKSACPTWLPSIAGYTRRLASCAAKRIAEGSRRARVSTAGP